MSSRGGSPSGKMRLKEIYDTVESVTDTLIHTNASSCIDIIIWKFICPMQDITPLGIRLNKYHSTSMWGKSGRGILPRLRYRIQVHHRDSSA